MTTPVIDTCGIPSKANWYLCVIVGREGETSDVNIYACDDHMPSLLDEGQDADSDYQVTYTRGHEKDWDSIEIATRGLFRFDNADAWEVLEVQVTHLR